MKRFLLTVAVLALGALPASAFPRLFHRGGHGCGCQPAPACQPQFAAPAQYAPPQNVQPVVYQTSYAPPPVQGGPLGYTPIMLARPLPIFGGCSGGSCPTCPR